MMIVAVVGIVGAHPTFDDFPAFTGFVDNAEYGTGSFPWKPVPGTVRNDCLRCNLRFPFTGWSPEPPPSSWTKRRDARPIAYGGMLIECALASDLSVCSRLYLASGMHLQPDHYPDRWYLQPVSSAVCAQRSRYLARTLQDVMNSMLVLAVSAFCLTSLDTATRLARYMFQEFWLEPGQTYKDAKGL